MQYLNANVISAWLPEMSIDLPFVGLLNIQEYVAMAILFVSLVVLFRLLRGVVVVRLKALSRRTSTDLDDTVIDAVHSIRMWVLIILALYISIQALSLPSWLDKTWSAVVFLSLVWQMIEVSLRFVDYFVHKMVEKDEDGDGVVDPNAATASDLIRLMSRITLWALGIIFVLSNLGIEVTSLIAGLGIGGIAIAFALQGILSDLFASFSIYFDKPFRIGDYVVLGADSGTVEKIGIKSTRIRTLQGEELVVSNAELTTARVQNFKKMQERRISSQFGITYETPHEKVKEVGGVVERIFEAIEGAKLDRVHLTSFGDSALIFDVVYYVNSPDYADFLDIQQRFNFELMDKFAEMGVEFAYPTQTIYHKAV